MWWVKQTADINMEKRFHRLSSKKKQDKITDDSSSTWILFFFFNQGLKKNRCVRNGARRSNYSYMTKIKYKKNPRKLNILNHQNAFSQVGRIFLIICNVRASWVACCLCEWPCSHLVSLVPFLSIWTEVRETSKELTPRKPKYTSIALN